MKEAGFLAAHSSMSADEALRWMNEINADATLPQPVTYTPQLIDRNLTALDSSLSRRISLPPSSSTWCVSHSASGLQCQNSGPP